MMPPKAGQVWSWHKYDLVYLVKKLKRDENSNHRWEWIDLNKGLHFKSPLTVGRLEGWELVVDV